MIELDHSYFARRVEPVVEGGGGAPLYKPYRDVTPQRVLFLPRLPGLRTGIDFAHFGLE